MWATICASWNVTIPCCLVMVSNMTPKVGLASLPLETCLVIFAKLDVDSLLNMAATSRGMRSVAKVCLLALCYFDTKDL